MNTKNFRFGITLFSAMLILALFAGTGGGAAFAQGLPPVTPEPPLIVGGAPADPGEWPWQVALVDGAATDLYADQFCGGSLVAKDWVVTAAHCVEGLAIADVDVVAGIYNLQTPAAGYQRRDVKKIVIHPSWNPATYNYDIALLRLKSDVILGGSGATKTQTIELVAPTIGDLAGFNSWVTGWGNTESLPLWPTQLYEVEVPIISNSICNDASRYAGGITNNMLCAGFDAGGKDSCQGDSGGPLVIKDVSGQYRLAGIVSWGDGCAEPMLPGVYTRVSNFTAWVKSEITPPPTVKTLISVAADDGWILESGENTSVGGSWNFISGDIGAGDDVFNKQYRTILSFSTSSLPDNAIISKATLRIRHLTTVGTSPFTTHGNLLGDIKKGSFSGLRDLQLADFASASSKDSAFVIIKTAVSNSWFYASLASANFKYVNLKGLTQVRLRFEKDDNNDYGADILRFYGGDAPTADYRPQLVIEYSLP
jgi:secreted trypsin-like serine protease